MNKRYCIIGLLVVIFLGIAYHYFSYTGRPYQKSMNEEWQVYSYDFLNNEMSDKPEFNLQIQKEKDFISLDYHTNHCDISYQNGLKECWVGSKRILFWFGDNLDCVAIEEWEDDVLSNLYLGMRDYIPFFNNTLQSRVKLIKKLAYTARPWFE